MEREYALAHLSMIEVAPQRLAAVAGEAGYGFTGFRLTPTAAGVDHRILGDPKALTRLKAAVDEAGVEVLDVEVIRMKAPEAMAAPNALLEAAGYLGARYVITTIEDDDEARRIDSLGELALLAASHGTGIAVEFMLFSSSPNLATTVALVTSVNAMNLVVLADVLHHERSGGQPADLGRYPARLFPYVQICGAQGSGPAPDAVTARTEAVNARLMPGNGDLPVAAFVAALNDDVILSVECPLAGEGNPTDPVALASAMLHSAQSVTSGKAT